MPSDTLILNNDGLPLSIVPLSTLSWQDSVKLFYVGRVSIISSYPNWEVHSPSMTLKVPSVILLNEYIKVSKSVKYSKENILLRDEYICQYCGISGFNNKAVELTMDHVIPRSNEGKTNWSNVVTACYNCNMEKAHHEHMKPKNAPRRINYYELVTKRKKFPLQIPDLIWAEFLDWDLDKIILKNDNRLMLK